MLKPTVHLVLTCLGATMVAQAAMTAADVPDESPPAQQVVETKASAKDKLKLPPGFKPRKRGKFVVYCRSDAPLGSRLKQETCLDENQIRDYMIALQETKGNVDRIRSTCSNVCTCGGDC